MVECSPNLRGMNAPREALLLIFMMCEMAATLDTMELVGNPGWGCPRVLWETVRVFQQARHIDSEA
jgi:hypothetical protein